jgi:DNA-binding transcriptional ArsR family regulator
MRKLEAYKAAPEQLDAIFAALADPTRRAILARLRLGDCTVKELTEPFNLSQAAISKHLMVLEGAGMVATVRPYFLERGTRPRMLKTRVLRQAAAWLEPYRKMRER